MLWYELVKSLLSVFSSVELKHMLGKVSAACLVSGHKYLISVVKIHLSFCVCTRL